MIDRKIDRQTWNLLYVVVVKSRKKDQWMCGIKKGRDKWNHSLIHLELLNPFFASDIDSSFIEISSMVHLLAENTLNT